MSKKRINVLCEQFFKMNNSSECLFGGGERWLYDFVALLKKLNYDVECYQFSTKPWTKRYKQMVIKGLGNITTNNFTINYNNGMKQFHKLSEKADGLFLLSMNLSIIPAYKPTLTVSHGIMFDYGNMQGQTQRPRESLDSFKNWIKNATATISVDTNSIQIMNVYDYLTSQKMVYIPNYVDLDKFTPNEKINDNEFIVLYPRRLQFCRGYTFMMDAVDVLREKYSDMKFIFCGKGNQQEELHFNSWLNKNPKNIEYMWADMADMPKVYKKSTISIIPTTYAEGTSLSCLESLASGVPPIVTTIGGLTDLVFPNVNGLMIPPSSTENIVSAIEYCYNNREHLLEMRENGLRMIKHFDKKRWDEQIGSVIKLIYGESQ